MLRPGSWKPEAPPATAIVGIGCLLPGGAADPEAFWRNLLAGVDGIVEVPAGRWSRERYFDPEPGKPGRAITRWGGFVEGIEGFDAELFGISPREATAMDPQQRQALQVAWHALEDALIPADSLAGRATGVFLGCCGSDYAALQRHRRSSDAVSNTGVATSIVANRVSHRLDLRGPSLVVDTACSSSLVAVHLACRALAAGECDLALAGGVNALLDPAPFVGFSQAGMMSPTGRMHMFDHRADGYVRAEGAVILVLEPLERALAAGRRIHALIRATWVNQDGHTATMTAPSAEAQQAMLEAAAAAAGIDPAGVAYVEAHGTGTPVGDPIEARAIGAAFGRRRANGRRLLVGSVKTQTGHLEAAAGATGLAKTALVLRHRLVPPNLHFERPNPAIAMDELGLEVPTAPAPLAAEGPLFAAVNSFGFGGTNACAILESPPPAEPAEPAGPPPARVLLPLSAAGPGALARLAEAVADRLEAEPDTALEDVAWSLATGRARLGEGLALVAGSRGQAIERLRAFARGEPALAEGEAGPAPWLVGRRAPAQPIVFVFTGQGGQWWGMGRALLERDPVFRAEVERFDAVFRTLAGWSAIEELGRPKEESRVDETRITQPTIFAVQIGLAARWRAFGVEPAMVLGHSFGEVAAAYVAGALSLEDAAALIWHRGRLQQGLEGSGAMAALGLGVEEVRPYLARPEAAGCEVAAVNGPTMTTLGGPRSALEAVLAAVEAERPGTFARLLKLQAAYHTAGMEPIREAFLEALAGLRPRPARLPIVSTVTGREIAGEALDALYWWRNVREPVLFQPAVERALATGSHTFLELGPHVTLAGPLGACLAHRGVQGFVQASLHREQDELDTLWAALAALWVRGLPLDWEGVLGAGRRAVPVPLYPFETRRFWAPCEEARAMLHNAPVHPLLGERVAGPQPRWRNELDLASHPFLADHRVDGSVLFPGAGHVELMLAAAREVLGDGPIELEGVTLHEGLFLDREGSELLETVFDPERGRITVHSRSRDGAPEWTLRASGRARRAAAPPPAVDPDPEGTAEGGIDAEAFYAAAAARRYEYGPLFRGVARARPNGVGVRGEVVRPAGLSAAAPWCFHPALLDACLQTGIPLLGEAAPDDLHLPRGFARVRWFAEPGERVHVALEGVRRDPRATVCDVLVRDPGGRAVLAIEGFETRRLPARARRGAEAARRPVHWRDGWQEAALEERAGGGPTEAAAALPGEPGAWLLLADAGGLVERLAGRLRAAGQRCLLVEPGPAPARPGPAAARVRPGVREDLAPLVEELARGPLPWRGIVQGWALDAAELGGEPTGAELSAFQERACLPVLQLVQLLAARPRTTPRLWIVTRGARRPTGEPADGPARAEGLAQVPLHGLARTVASEQEGLRCTTVDLDPAEDGLEGLWAELVADGPEPEVALRDGRRFVSRLERVEPTALPPLHRPARDPAIASWRLAMPTAGVLDTMRPVERARPEPGPGELLIAVQAVALNFRDVMAASGLLPEDAEPDPAHEALGTECAGTVLAIGPGVEGFRPGERVATMARGCFGAHATVPAAMVVRVPEGLSAAEAATVPVGFLTAWHALLTMGRMQPGERVLIHVATGGVGLAAIQIARMIGAEIFATAGSEAKRAYLRGLGIRHVMNSRTLDFADEILAATEGRGVDLVLNSLPGPFLEKSLAVLAPHGRFLELGKRDIYGDTPLGLKALRRNAAFFAIDLANVDPRRAGTIRAALDALEDHLRAGRITPLPFERFPASKAVDAFRHMAQARHIGKIVVELDDPTLEVALDPGRPLRLRADASYLVTGGLGGFGLEVARFLAGAGAGHLVLVGRSGAASEAARAVVAELEAAGTRVTVARADVTRPEEVRAVVEAIAASGLPLAGVVHGAMVLDDGFLTQLDAERFARALAPKLVGAWNLHRATLDLALDHFVMFSSVAAMLGSKGQANYVAGNLFLDALALHRRARGLPALTINWGALGEAGFVARTEAMARYLESSGIALVPLAESLAALARLLRCDPGAVGFAAIDWDVLARAAGGGPSPRFAHLVSAVESGGGRLRAELLAAPAERRPAMVARFLCQQIAKVLRVEEGKIEAERPLADVGLDSLTAFELKNRIEGELALTLPVAKLLQQPTVRSLTAAVLERLGGEAEAAAGADGVGSSPAGAAGAETAGPEPAALSVRQEMLLQMFAPGHEISAEHRDYMLAFGLAIRPALDLGRLSAAFDAALARHPMLRARFPRVDGRVTLAIDEARPRGVEVVDAEGLDEAGLREAVRSLAEAPFDLERGPLCRLVVFHTVERDVLVLRIFHAVTDGWSSMLLVMELFGRYFGLADPALVTDAPPAAEYTDFVRWQRAMMAGPEGAAHRAYWEARLEGLGPRLGLPYDRPRRLGRAREAGALGFVLDRALSRAVRAFAAESGTTPYTVLFAAFDTLILGLTGEVDLPVNAVAAGRTRPEFANVVGWFVNRMIVRHRLEPEGSFALLVRGLHERLARDLEHQDYPVAPIAEALRTTADGRPTSLGQLGFYMSRPDHFDDRGFGPLLLEVGDARLRFGSLEVASYPVNAAGADGDLSFREVEVDGRFHFDVRYNADCFERTTVERIVEGYRALLERALAEPELPLARLVGALAFGFGRTAAVSRAAE